MPMWRPKNPKAITLIKLTCWSGILVWMVCYLAFGIVLAPWLASKMVEMIGGLRGEVMGWVVAIWFIFTILLTIVLIARFVNKKIGRKKKE